MDFLTNGNVAIAVTSCYHYPPKETLFRPDNAYPEYFFGKEYVSLEKNEVYSAVRKSLYLLGLDAKHYGTQEWNPLKDFVKPGDNVLIKPNMVMDCNLGGKNTDCLYTQPSVVAPMVDYVLVALHGNGKIIIGDAPMQECKFERLIEESGYKALVEWYKDKGVDIDLMDFRGLFSESVKGVHFQHINKNAKGKIINLGADSEFVGIGKTAKKLRVTNYNPAILNSHHTAEKHEYFVGDELLKADCVINMPKPKTHRLAGVTISQKNFVGISVRKEFLPHHTMGSQEEGGDEYQKKDIFHAAHSLCLDKKNCSMYAGHRKTAFIYFEMSRAFSLVMRLRGKCYRNGAWYGNHTINRTIADLNKIVRYADKNGQMSDISQRNMLIVADMIVSGEKEGPVKPSPKNLGIIAAGVNPVCFDEAIAALMGFDIEKIPTLQIARKVNRYKLVDAGVKAKISSNKLEYDGCAPTELNIDTQLRFIPTTGWIGHIERN